jgi:hypothetical protein
MGFFWDHLPSRYFPSQILFVLQACFCKPGFELVGSNDNKTAAMKEKFIISLQGKGIFQISRQKACLAWWPRTDQWEAGLFLQPLMRIS